MAQYLDDGEFWLPPRFLSDDQLLLSRSLYNRDAADCDFMAGLTGKLARSTLSGHSLAPNYAKGRSHNGSTMTLEETSPAATWMRSPTPTVKTHPGFYQRPLQAAAKLEMLRQHRSGHVRGTGGGGGAISIRGPPPPPLHSQANGYSVCVGAKRECAGTGVFLPRRNVAAPKKPGCSVIVPARVARALNLNLEEMGGQPQLVNGRIGRGRFEHPPQPGRKHEIRLPQEWTY